jgi:hypothetical protein
VVKSVSADSLSRIPQGDVMGSSYSPPLSQYDAASVGVVFLELNWHFLQWVVKKLKKNRWRHLSGGSNSPIFNHGGLAPPSDWIHFFFETSYFSKKEMHMKN